MPINSEFLARLAVNDPSVKKMELRPETGVDLNEIKQLVEAAKNNTYLTTLILVDQDIDDEKAIALSALENIEILTLASNKITDKGVKALSEMPKLQRLGLGGNNITNEGAKYLAKTNLVHLDLYGNELTNDVEDIFLSNKNLTFLGLNFNKIDKSILTEIQKHIESNKKRISERNTNDLQSVSLAVESGSSLFSKKLSEAKEQTTEATSPAEQGKIKSSIISQFNLLPEDARKELIEDLLQKYNLNIQPSKQTFVK